MIFHTTADNMDYEAKVLEYESLLKKKGEAEWALSKALGEFKSSPTPETFAAASSEMAKYLALADEVSRAAAATAAVEAKKP